MSSVSYDNLSTRTEENDESDKTADHCFQDKR